MSVTNTFDSVVEQQWAEEAHIAWEQRQTKFRGRSREMLARAKTANFQVLTDTAYHTGKARNAPIIVDAQNFVDKTCSSQLYYTSMMIDEPDEALVNFNYRDTITKRCLYQINHAIDDVIITSLMAWGGSNQGANMSSPYTSNYAGMNFIAQQLDENDVPMEDRHCVLHTKAYRTELLADSVFINNFSVYQDAIASGQIEGGLCAGLNTFWSTRLQAGTESNSFTCFAWHKDSVGVLISEDVTVHVDWVPQNLGYQFSASIQLGAVVIDNLGVVGFDVV